MGWAGQAAARDGMSAARAAAPFRVPDRFPLALLPTPLVPAPRLARALGVRAPLLVKRDDLTGLAFAGNKARPLEFLVAAALAEGADTLLAGGGPGSNFCAAAAAAAQKAGLACHLVIAGTGDGGAGPEAVPALAVARACGAEVSWTGSAERGSVDDALLRAAVGLAAGGRRPYLVPRGGATPLGAVGYALAAAELRDQLAERGAGSARIVVAVGSGGTLAGLIAGNVLLGRPWTLVGGSASRPPGQAAERVLTLARDCLRLLGSADGRLAGQADAQIVDVRGPGHGLPSPAGAAAAAQAMRTEGLMLDPVYTAKALPLVAESAAPPSGQAPSGQAPSGQAPPGQAPPAGPDGAPVVFWHTGGALDVVAEALGAGR